ncbi:hypothetical protein BMF94_0808 [Rhodotorula taiwanensis]|uniref:Ribosomal RNA-processing protein 7 C-terminal domain-containing protein n=1 Tax=Rhodotorula taiwanensis TaxID=741276 RepID=A0A2S5BH52_9BASI|nr:hypothetical protein BMF94_0808 [Rhodotorula taiwanensis]
MGRLPTQPDMAQVIPLRSGFYALPLNNSKTHLFARLHHGHTDDLAQDDDATEGATGTTKQLFVTALPAGVSEKGLKAAFGKVFGDDNKVKSVRFLANGTAHSYSTLLEKDLLTSQVQDGDEVPAPLFDPSQASASTSTAAPAPQSAILTFASAPSLPPPSYPASTPLTLPVAPAYLAVSAARHALARPHRSVVIAHVDEWMRAYDARKLAAAPATYSAEAAAAEAAAEAKRAKKQKGRKGKAVDVGPLPGSAAEALAKHAAARARYNDASFNPDEAEEGEWQTVSRGGRHGKSLLPTGVVPTVSGYGGVTVKVAGKKRGRLADAETPKLDAGVRKIVGDSFYAHSRAQARSKELAHLKARFEEDKTRVDRMRTASGGGRGGFRGGRGGGSGGARGGRGRFKPY